MSSGLYRLVHRPLDFTLTFQIFTYIALAEHKQLGYGGLGRGTIKPSLVPNLLETLDTARYKYEDFWILIARNHSQWPRSADPGNAWGMFKLERLDFIRYHSGEGVFWNQSRFGRVAKELGKFSSYPTRFSS